MTYVARNSAIQNLSKIVGESFGIIEKKIEIIINNAQCEGLMDKVSKDVRSRNMSAIKGKDTKPEILVRKYLFAKGFRYKLYDKSLPGKPDLVFPKYKTVVFIHGCFWHGHEGCKYFVVPKTHTEWWITKINRNKQLDAEHNEKLRKMDWKIITIFECRLKPKYRIRTLNLLSKRLAK